MARTLGLNQNSIAGLNIYPNPARNGKVYTTSNSTSDKSIIIYDYLGKEVLQTIINTKELNISSLSAGVYTIKISESEAITTRKLIVQ